MASRGIIYPQPPLGPSDLAPLKCMHAFTTFARHYIVFQHRAGMADFCYCTGCMHALMTHSLDTILSFSIILKVQSLQSLNIILFFSLTLLGQILVIAYEGSKGRNDMILVLYSEELFEINPGAKRSTLPTLCSHNQCSFSQSWFLPE